MTLTGFNQLNDPEKAEILFKCCGSLGWVNKMLAVFPVASMEELLHHAENNWAGASENDYREAFSHHPKIGDVKALEEKFASTAAWASGEQAGVNHANEEIVQELADSNEQYEQKFGYIFIVCATGKSAIEMLGLLKARLLNRPEEEIRIAAAEQGKITTVRLKKIFA